uniref:Uncharacterized protein n=1 Tax=Lactuca sativa TaxID=4236 RepID=A0A9R1UIE2_LACSA|nr:hypothetical protein LSAT_V11C900472380 [Lactuca sativa]
MEEIKSALWCYSGEKAPGPGSFSFKLIKTKWELMKGDIFIFINHFERSGSIPNGCNSFFITLIPKVSDPLNLVFLALFISIALYILYFLYHGSCRGFGARCGCGLIAFGLGGLLDALLGFTDPSKEIWA